MGTERISRALEGNGALSGLSGFSGLFGGVFDAACASLLALTYDRRVSAFRPLPDGSEAAVCRDAPCALSRSAMISAPEPPDGTYILPEALYRLSLYTPPDLCFRLGDRAEVRDGGGRVFHGRTSDSFPYASHCVTVLEVSEILEDPKTADRPHVRPEEAGG